MVYFVCMACQETLKRNAVDKHCLRCRDCWDLVCVDCNKVFSGEAFRSHVTCMSEAERYQGKLYRPKHKGKRSPQDVWMESVHAVNAAPPIGMSTDQVKLLKIVARMNNVPRKLKKFTNVINNSCRGRATPEAITGVFEALNAHFLAQRKDSQNTKIQAKETTDSLAAGFAVKKGGQCTIEKCADYGAMKEEKTKKAKKKKKKKAKAKKMTLKKHLPVTESAPVPPESPQTTQPLKCVATSSGAFRWKKTLKRVLKDAKGHQLPLKKARKKMYKLHCDGSVAGATVLSKEEFKAVFMKKFGNRVADGIMSLK
eukprot:g1626.t1